MNRSVDESIAAAGELTTLAHSAKTPVEAIVSTAFGCPYEGDVPETRVAGLAGQLAFDREVLREDARHQGDGVLLGQL